MGIKEWSGDKDAGHSETFTTLSAKPGTTRYFRCEWHCGPSKSRFEVSCPAKEVNCKNKNKNETCDQLLKKITNKKKRKQRCKKKTKIYSVKKKRFVKNKKLKQICPLYCDKRC